MIDVLGLGSVALDEILVVDHWPEPDEKMRVASRSQRLGGLTGHALVAAAKAGARCAYAGRLGTDATSLAVAEALAAAEIDLTHAPRAAEYGVGRSVIISALRERSRNVFSQATGMTGAHDGLPGEEVLQQCRVLFVDHHGIDGALRAIRAVVDTVADLERDDHPRFSELLSVVNHLVLSAGFARRITGAATAAEAVTRLWHPGREVVIVTAGAEGCWWQDRSHVGAQHFPALRVEARDTSGCGDVFHGVYAAKLALGEPIEARIRSATEAAGRHAAAER